MNNNYKWDEALLGEGGESDFSSSEDMQLPEEEQARALEFNEYLSDSIESIMQAQVEDTIELPSISRIDVDKLLTKFAKNFIKELRESVLGGKLNRGLALLYHALSGAKDREDEIRMEYFEVAAAIELFQNSMLIHDDIIDKDKRRRGRAASWTKIGVEKAILLGDLYLMIADMTFYDAILKLREKEAISDDAFDSCRFIWDSMKRDVIVGQVIDVDFSNTPITNLKNKRTQNKMIEMNSLTDVLKTASYTTLAPFLLGKVIGKNIDLAEIEDIEVESSVLEGVMYQMSNDQDDFGKDLRQGHISGFVVMLFNSFGDNAEFMEKIFELADKQESITDKDVHDFEDFIHELEVLEDKE
ncbi:MAG: polyprenyl synthetase family protein [Candidatus Ancillula sp.]|jgi:geranylgeranyl pyrophosphate synthase|nr:polyprenyl synthetase family protein [Candidatus Ancillula sp.]